MSDKMLDVVARPFRALETPVTFAFFRSSRRGEYDGELVRALDGNQPNVSKHLQILSAARLIGRRREGTSILYAISDQMVSKLCALVCNSELEISRREFQVLRGQQGQEKR